MLSAAALAAAALAGPVAEGAPVGDGPIGTFGSVVVVSRRVGERYRLAELVDGRLRDLDVPSRDAPFDVDLGPDRSGLVAAVYSRCRTKPGGAYFETGVSYRTAEGCRLYRVRVRGGREQRLLRSRPRAASTSRFLPSLWRGKLVWSETEDNRFEAPRIATPRLMIRTAGGRMAQLPGGPRFFKGSDVGVEGPRSLDLRGDRLGFAWHYISERPSCRDDDDYYGFIPAGEVRAGRLGHPPGLFERSGCTSSPKGLDRVSDITATAGGWETTESHRDVLGRSETRLVARTLDGRVTSSPVVPSVYTSDPPREVARSGNRIISIEPDRVPRLHISELP